jgi:hypothetical protein
MFAAIFDERLITLSVQFDFDSRKFRSYHKRLQTFLPFFIDGARFIDDADDRWEIYVTCVNLRLVFGK